MPVALSTTKRKFHKILDSISNASSVSLVGGNDKFNGSTTTLPASIDPPAKKPRVARPASTYVSPNTPTAAMTTTKTRTSSVVSQPTPTTRNDNNKPPHFAPWDREQFLKRLKTYRHVDKWRGKPEKINEVQWSKRGWTCVGRERVSCVGGCSKEVVITLENSREDDAHNEDTTPDRQSDDASDDDWREKAQAQLVEKYAEMITTAHDGGCLWRRRGCDDTIQRLPLAHQDNAVENLRRRYRSLVAMSSDLPSNPSTPEGFDLSIVHDQLPTLLHPPPTNSQAEAISVPSSNDLKAPSTLNSPAMLLALFGWQAEEGHISGLATCTACFRRLGLWLFKPSSDSSIPSSMDRLDVVGEHRDYCPWVNALSQNGASSRRTSLEGFAGWQVLLRAVQASALHKKYDSDKVPALAPQDSADDAVSEVGSWTSSATVTVDRKDQDEKDKERWAKLRRLKQVFHVKRTKEKNHKKGGINV